MAGAAISGLAGDVKIGSTSIFEITKWSFNPKVNVSKYASNKTAGYKAAVPGVKDGSGSCEGKWVTAQPAYAVLTESTLVTLNLYINATQFWAVPSCVEGFKMDVDLDTGDIVGWSADFQTNGAWTPPVAGLTFDPEQGLVGPDGLPVVFAPDAPLQTEGVPLTPEQQIKQELLLQEAKKRAMMRSPDLMIAEAVEQTRRLVKPDIDELKAMMQQLMASMGGKVAEVAA